MIVNLALWVAGAALIVLGAAMIRAPLARVRELDATQANLARYDSWRGGRRTAAVGPGGETGADVMRRQLRSRVALWAVAITVGIVLVIAGFAVR